MRSIHRQRGWIPAAIGAVAGLAGGLLGNEARSDEASWQRDYQTQMANTAWQRAVADMRAAGLNPMLAYSQGPAASMPGAQPPHIENIGLAAVQGAEAGAQSEQASAQAERTSAETMPYYDLTRKLEAEIEEIWTRSAANAARGDLSKAETKRLEAETRIALVQAKAAETFLMDRDAAELKIILAEAKRAVVSGEITDSRYGEWLMWIERFVHTLGSALSGIAGGVVGGVLGSRRGGLGVRPPRQTSPEYFRGLRRE